jgi:hypothetical protein
MISNPVVTLVPGGMLFDSNEWFGQLSNVEFRRVVRSEPRVQTIPFDRRAPRSVLIYDDLGLYALEDADEGRIVCVAFAFHPTRTPFPPNSPFSGRLSINGTCVNGNMTEGELPLVGEMNFVRGIGRTWKFAHDNAYVEFNLHNTTEKSRRPRLTSVTHSFLEN